MLCRICCNPHIFAFCFIDSCLKKGSAEAFAESAGLSASAEYSSQSVNPRFAYTSTFPYVQQTVLCSTLCTTCPLHA